MRSLDCQTLDPIQTVQEFVARIAEFKASHDPTTWYRGHSDYRYKLVPTIGRDSRYNGKRVTFTAEQERQLLHRFRRRIYPHVDRILNEWEAILHQRPPVGLHDGRSEGTSVSFHTAMRASSCTRICCRGRHTASPAAASPSSHLARHTSATPQSRRRPSLEVPE